MSGLKGNKPSDLGGIGALSIANYKRKKLAAQPAKPKKQSAATHMRTAKPMKATKMKSTAMTKAGRVERQRRAEQTKQIRSAYKVVASMKPTKVKKTKMY